MTKEQTIYVREVKAHLNKMLKHPYAIAQVHVVQDRLVVDIKIKYRNLLHGQRSDLYFHDAYPMPLQVGYCTAKAQAEFIIGCYNSMIKAIYLVD